MGTRAIPWSKRADRVGAALGRCTACRPPQLSWLEIGEASDISRVGRSRSCAAGLASARTVAAPRVRRASTSDVPPAVLRREHPVHKSAFTSAGHDGELTSDERLRVSCRRLHPA